MNSNKQKVLILGCNHDQIPYINEIKSRGFFVIGTDKNNDAPGKHLCDEFFNIGYDNIEQLIDIAKKELSIDDYIFTAGAQFAYVGVSKICNYLSKNYPSYQSIEMCLDKNKFYQEFHEFGINIPKTQYIKSSSELITTVKKMSTTTNSFYLKSDHSKNPNYIYKFSSDTNLKKISINWKKDRYFKKFYILQEEFFGTHLRLNIYGDVGNIYLFNDSNISLPNDQIISNVKYSGVLSTLKMFLQKHNLNKFLVKFDIVINSENEYVVLDIGLDPPFRMNQHFTNYNGEFYKNYIDQYFDNKINYPILENCICF